MVGDQVQVGQQIGDGEETDDGPLSTYVIDLEAAGSDHRSMALLIADRRCYVDQQAGDEPIAESADAQGYIDRIQEHCGQTSDYLLPDTPLKEAIFRVILAGGNEPMDARQISQILGDKWAMTPFPRDVSVRVLGRLLDHSEFYAITKIPEPEPEVPEVIEAIKPPEQPAEASVNGETPFVEPTSEVPVDAATLTEQPPEEAVAAETPTDEPPEGTAVDAEASLEEPSAEADVEESAEEEVSEPADPVEDAGTDAEEDDQAEG